MVGGTEVPNSPTVDYLDKIVLPIYRKLGAKIEFKVAQRGYYPKGGGILKLSCSRHSESKPLLLETAASNHSAAYLQLLRISSKARELEAGGIRKGNVGTRRS